MTLATLLLALLTATNPSSGGGASDPVLLDFHADWCGPCRQMRPAVDQLSRKGYPVKSINIDRAKAMADRYGVDAVPTFIVVDPSGRELDRTSGLQPAAELERFYLAARAKAQPPGQANAHAVPRDADDALTDDADPDEDAAVSTRAAGARRTGRAAMTAMMTSDAVAAGRQPARVALRQPPSGRDRGADQGDRPPLDRLRLGDDHLQLARGVAHPDLRAHLQAGGPGQGGAAGQVPSGRS